MTNMTNKDVVDETTLSSCSSLIDREMLLRLSNVNNIINKRKERSYRNIMPNIYYMKYEHFRSCGQFPCYSHNNLDIKNVDKIDTSKVFIIFISHTWLYKRRDDVEGEEHEDVESVYHPDDIYNTHYHLCINGIEKILYNHVKNIKDCYVWVDYSCLNQDVNPVLEMEELDKIMECCDCILTPVIDNCSCPQSNSEQDVIVEKSSGMTTILDYKADGWKEYLSRSWTRLEMVEYLEFFCVIITPVKSILM